MQNENRDSMLSGLALMGAAALAYLYVRIADNRGVKLTALVLSGITGAAGAYLFVSGLSKEFLGQYGGHAYGEPARVARYENPAAFEASLLRYQDFKKAKGKDVRRLSFNCKDGSESFTVYFTPAGILNVPESNVVCKDGEKLLNYAARTERESN